MKEKAAMEAESVIRIKNEEQKKMRQHFFSLIELLVIVCILVILISMLLPALQKARIQARTIECAGHFKQLALGFSIYTGENEDYTPMEECTAYSTLWRERCAGKSGLEAVSICTEYRSAVENYNRSVSEGSRKDLNNPAHVWIKTAFYTGNLNLNNRKVVRIRQPSRTGTIIDGSFKGGKHLTGTLNYDQAGWRHIRNSTILSYVDGHVRTFSDIGSNYQIKDEFNLKE